MGRLACCRRSPRGLFSFALETPNSFPLTLGVRAMRFRLGILSFIAALVVVSSPAAAAPTERSTPPSEIPVELVAYVAPDGKHCDDLDRRGIACPDVDELIAALGGEDLVERWRPVVETYFEPEDVERAMAVLRCESTGDPEAANPSSSARGLFQHLESEWERRLDLSGWPGDTSIYDPVANTAVAAYLVYKGGGWSNWNASGYCW